MSIDANKAMVVSDDLKVDYSPYDGLLLKYSSEKPIVPLWVSLWYHPIPDNIDDWFVKIQDGDKIFFELCNSGGQPLTEYPERFTQIEKEKMLRHFHEVGNKSDPRFRLREMRTYWPGFEEMLSHGFDFKHSADKVELIRT